MKAGVYGIIKMQSSEAKNTVKPQLGEVELIIPRDRNGEFEPQIISKHQRNVTGIEEKILALYAAGMSTRDIHAQIQDLYDRPLGVVSRKGLRPLKKYPQLSWGIFIVLKGPCPMWSFLDL